MEAKFDKPARLFGVYFVCVFALCEIVQLRNKQKQNHDRTE